MTKAIFVYPAYGVQLALVCSDAFSFDMHIMKQWLEQIFFSRQLIVAVYTRRQGYFPGGG